MTRNIQRYIFGLLGLILFICPLKAQLTVEVASDILLPIDKKLGYFVSQTDHLPDLQTIMLGQVPQKSDQIPSLVALKYQPHLAFFCRVEVKIDKAVGTPFRFRLGSVDYVDYLEGKRSSY